MKKITLLFGFVVLLLVSDSCRHKDLEDITILCGIITNRETGEPIDKAKVLLLQRGQTSTTSSNGIYEFIDIKTKECSLQVECFNYETNHAYITVKFGETNIKDITLAKLK
jgi:hypothetical protein